MKKKQELSRSPLKLIIIYLLVTFFIIVVGIRYYLVQIEEVKNEIHTDLSVIANFKVKQIENWRSEKLGDAYILFNNKYLIPHIANWIANRENTKINEMIISHLGLYIFAYHFKDVLVFDTNSNIVFAKIEKIKKLGKKAIELFDESKKSKKPIFSNIYFCEESNDIHLDICIPLLENDKLIGGIILRIDPQEFLFPLIQSWPTSSETAETLLISKQDDYVIYLNELKHQNKTTLKLKFKLDSSNYKIPAVQAVLGREGLFEGVDYRGVPVLSDIRKVKDSPWFMVSKVDLDEIYEPVYAKAINVSILTALVLISFAIGFIWVWSNQKKAIKIQQLKDEAQRKALVKHFEYLVKYSNDIFILFDKDLNIIDGNERAFKTYGYSRDEFLKLNVRNLRTTDSLPQLYEQIKKVEEENEALYETIHLRKDGSAFPVEVSLRVVEIEGLKYYQAIIRDITERKKAETEIKLSEEKFSKIFQSSPYAIVLTQPSDGKIIDINKSFTNITGFQYSDVLGKSTYDLNIWLNIEDRNYVINQLSKGNKVYGKEFGFRKKSGEEAVGLYTAELISIDNQYVMMSSFTDITNLKKAEEEIRNLVLRYHLILSTQYYGTLVVSADNKIEFVNDKFIEFFQLNETKSELIGITAEEMIAKILPKYNNPEYALSLIKKLVEKGQPSFDNEIEMKNGKIFLVDFNPIFIDSKYSGRVWQHRDITERIEQQKLILKEKEWSDKIISLAPNIIVALGEKSKIILFNKFAERLTGYKAEEVLGKEWIELFIPEENKKELSRVWDEIVDNKFIAHQYENPIVTKNGEVKIIRWNNAVISENNKFKMVLSIGEDITERVKTDKELKDREERLRLSLKAGNQGLYDLNVQTGEAIVNDEYALMLGFNPITFKETNSFWIERLHPDDIEIATKAYKDFLSGLTKEYRVEFRQKTKDGNWIWILSMGEIVEYDSEGKPLRMLGTHTDITEMKKAGEMIKKLNEELEQKVKERTFQLQKTVEELEAFSYSVSHDLRAPLRGIDGFSLALLEDYFDKLDDKAKEYITRIRNSTNLMDELIDSLLKLSRVTRFEMNYEKVNLTMVAKDVIEMIKSLDKNRNVEFIIADNIFADCDKYLISILIQNLFNNAWKFTAKREKAIIELGTFKKDSDVVYFVKDNGVGFDMKYYDKLFGAFQRLHSKKEYPGTGIGLATVQRIINRHNGKIWAESEIGKGTTFYFTLKS